MTVLRACLTRARAVSFLVLLMTAVALLPTAHSAVAAGAAPTTSTGWIIGLQPHAASTGAAAVQPAVGDARVAQLRMLSGVYVAQFTGATKASDGVARLIADPAVRYVEPDIRYAYDWEPNDPYYPNESWTRVVHLSDAWSIATGKPSTVVAVVDSGVRADHPDLAGKVLAGFDFLDNGTNTTDNVGHGTAVAGIIAARGNDGIGIAGAAMDVSILPVKVGNADGAPVSAIAQGVVYAVDQGASVINLSLGSESPSPTLEDAIKYAYSKNVVVVAAAGNQADQVSFPASYQQTISVGAANANGDGLANFSSRLSRVDLTAPGVGLVTSYWTSSAGDTWASATGTSFSAPVVSGTIALMRSVDPGMFIEDIRHALTATARQTYPAGTLGGGAGLLDSAEALRRALLPSMTGTWQASDQPVASGAAPRTWLWGPIAFEVGTEPYAQTQHGDRLVAYFDKARMEITNPYGDRGSAWYVTNGLLVTEMITGRVQVGNAEFQQESPAAIPVAGDPDDTSGPTYASFTGLLGAKPLDAGATIVQTIDRAGTVGTDDRLAGYGVTAADYIPQTGHCIANVFASYLSSNGTMLLNGQYQSAPLFNPAFYATGYPITEAYWARVKVAGKIEDVLVQCFERRCLTYTPSNPDGWKVEMGNVGLHYYRWRFGTPPTGPAPDDPSQFAVGPH